MDSILAISHAHKLAVIEDACQAHGSEYKGRRCGTLGDIACFSFYPGKNLGAYGDAGAVTTDDDDVAETVRALGNHGGTRKYEHRLIGVNSRLDTLQAVVLRAKLRLLPAWNEQRRAAARRYDEGLAGVEGVRLPTVLEGNVAVHHLYVVEVDDRDDVLAALQAEGVGAGIHYPTPVHRTEAFSSLGLGEGSFPVAEGLSRRILSLPIFPGITEAQQEVVLRALEKALA
jgi:dTDP-4-amino-4,6-dideoxygalactose transaminase